MGSNDANSALWELSSKLVSEYHYDIIPLSSPKFDRTNAGKAPLLKRWSQVKQTTLDDLECWKKNPIAIWDWF